MENMVNLQKFWKDKKVFITGHTGFKGGWLSLWLQTLQANVVGYALAPTTKVNLFELAGIEQGITSIIDDIRDYKALKTALEKHQPDIVFHLAAQPLVRLSYQYPIDTYMTNVMGSVNLFEAIRQLSATKVVINVTSDKCYENQEWHWGYRENDKLGGHDPYSNSKACAELVTQAYRNSFFNTATTPQLASVRAGNVIGGGDWSEDRLIPDIIRAYINKQPISLRFPQATRPWQHVLDPLHGYLRLAQKMYEEGHHAEAWNFGPDESDVQTVEWIVKNINQLLDNKVTCKIETIKQPHEAGLLKLDCTKSKTKLIWQPRWNIKKGLLETTEWYKAYIEQQDMRQFTLNQINSFMN